MKFNIKKTNILLIDMCDKTYELLKEAGFENIAYIKSMDNATKYFDNNPDELNDYDCFLFGASYSPGRTHWDKDEFLMEHCKKNNKLYMYFLYVSDDCVPSLDKITVYEFIGGWRETHNITFEGLVNEVEDCIGQLKNLSERPITYKEPVRPEKDLLPSKCSELKVLFCSYENYWDLVATMLADLGIGSISITVANNYTFENYFRYVQDYDLVIADELFCSYFIGNSRYDLQEILKYTSHPAVTFIIYKKDGDCYGDKPGFGTISYSVSTVAEEITPCFKVKHSFFGKRYEQVRAMLENSLNIYNEINPIEDLPKFNGPEYYQGIADDLKNRERYWGDIDSKVKYTQYWIKKYLELFRKMSVNRIIGLDVLEVSHPKNTEPFNLEEDENYITITYSVLAVPLYALHVPVKSLRNQNRPILIETANKKGTLTNKRVIDLEETLNKRSEELSEEETTAILTIYNLTLETVMPIVQAAERRQTKREEPVHKKKRRPYDKRIY